MVEPVITKITADRWKVGGVSVVGFSHIEEGTPCQDAFAVKVTNCGRLIAAVADGAGSTKLSHIGAQAFVDDAVSRIHALPTADEFDPQRIADEIIATVNKTRKTLIKTPGDSESETPLSLRDFASTFLMTVADAHGGAFFHVGDGAGTHFMTDNTEAAIVSKPENGEYANETFFVTMDEWERHLRIMPFDGPTDTILLMSDGVTPMAMTKGCAGPFDKFVKPVVDFLKTADRQTGETALINTLSADNVRAVTGDDKTLLWAIRTPD